MNSSTVTETFFATCPRGLEPTLAAELEALGMGDVAPTAGGVGFTGKFTACYRVNLESRIASRVLWRVARAGYRNEEDIYRAATALPWPAWFGAERTIRVYVAAIRSPLRSLDFITLRIKDAVCDNFRTTHGARPDVDTRRPDVRIHAFLTRDEITLYLDTSGDALFKRGRRDAAGTAPLRENLAAGILRLAGWSPEMPLLDPMCGSGTFLIEAALIALDIAPGINRSFGFEKLANFDERRWRTLKDNALRRHKSIRPAIFGADIDAVAINNARSNLALAGLDEAVQLTRASVLDLSAPAPAGVLVANPPYGVRVGEPEKLAAFYPKLGDVLKRNFAGWRALLFSADPQLPKLIRLKAARRTPLYNGALECRLFEYRLVAGSMRDRPPVSGSA
ncbi:MAG TPA: THUMP domain-containing protein [Burkholderiales bacterium]|nr:THUMP domain-containing protein [Burkholderiales bacterium]